MNHLTPARYRISKRLEKNFQALGKKFLSAWKFYVIGACLFCCLDVNAETKRCADRDWLFYYGDGSAAVENIQVTDGWRRLDLPHDWSVETEAARAAGGEVIGPFSTNSIGGYQTGHTVGGEGWYYKRLDLTAEQVAEMHNELYFEGAYNQANVYVNGEHIYNNVYGYQSFRVDLEGKVHEGRNDILVQVRNEGSNSRWYAGSGIYRHVWLVQSPALYVSDWGTYVKAQDERVVISTVIFNITPLRKKAQILINLKDALGKTVTSKTVNMIAGGRTQYVKCAMNIPNVQKWSPQNPYLYTAEIIAKDTKTNVCDTLRKHFGVRKLEFTAKEGFRLNGKPVLLKGGCIHHDNGLLGAAAYDAAELWKLKRLMAQGFNAIRLSHNMASDNLLNLCDSLGLMVVDESFDQWIRKKNKDDYHNHFRRHSQEDIKTMVRRDRNHPSVIMWSIGNEIPGRIEPEGITIAERLRKAILELDDTRPVTAAICSWDEGDEWNSAGHGWDLQDEKAFLSLDIGGYNYLYDKYKHDHETHPDRVMFGAESYPKQASQNWDLVEELPYVIGDFVWTAMDYLGEAGIGSSAFRTEGNQSMFQPWPWFNGWCGDLDICGQKKPQSYYRDVVWRQQPITMATALPAPAGQHESISWWGWQQEQQSWTYSQLQEGDPVIVNVYSRAPKVRLYQNGEVIAENETSQTYHAGFNVKYIKGELKAVNLDKSGKEVKGESFVLTTTGNGTDLRLQSDKDMIRADGTDLAYVTIELIDSKGRVVTSDSNRKVKITVEGAGTLLASGNASPTDMESFRSPNPRLFNGKALAIVKSSDQAGEVLIRVESDGLPTTIKHIKTK